MRHTSKMHSLLKSEPECYTTPLEQAPSWSILDPVWHHAWHRCDEADCQLFIDAGQALVGSNGLFCSQHSFSRSWGAQGFPLPESRWPL